MSPHQYRGAAGISARTTLLRFLYGGCTRSCVANWCWVSAVWRWHSRWTFILEEYLARVSISCDRYGQYDNPSVTMPQEHWYIRCHKGWLLQLGSYLASLQYWQTERVQIILNAEACLVLLIPKFVPVSAWIKDSLLWLPADSEYCYWLQIASTKEHHCICWFQRCRGVGTYCLLTSSVWWSIAVGNHRCRSGDSLLLDRWRGTICQRLHVFR